MARERCSARATVHRWLRRQAAVVGLSSIVVLLLCQLNSLAVGATPDLLSTILTDADVDPGWTAVGAPMLTEDGAVAVFVAGAAGDALIVHLFPVGATSPRAAVERSLQYGAAFGGPAVVGEEVAPPDLGEDTVRLRLAVTLAGITTSGDLLAWRQGELVAVVQMLSPTAADALPYAERQDRKMRSM